ncbi:hypothetical protein AVEN_78717-1 [Araneus ventricosus]|uniref:Uncharacterized protein n=1 Tax=Araneus ventricosus TaxID=182803 RepID=A0A4Y2EIJ3_ARAVE|nr:hypothetical protein AVEN_78717-1 [Araneus ventricosus]
MLIVVVRFNIHHGIYSSGQTGKSSCNWQMSESMVCTADITEAVQNVVNCIINAANNSSPKSSSRPKKFRRPWWNEACRDSRREEKKQWNIFRRYPTTENHVTFKRAKALARRIRRRSQRESWINFISSITSSISSKQLWEKSQGC